MVPVAATAFSGGAAPDFYRGRGGNLIPRQGRRRVGALLGVHRAWRFFCLALSFLVVTNSAEPFLKKKIKSNYSYRRSREEKARVRVRDKS